ncbi:hypothetical protein GCM10023201_21120 [Actinomycetospora corticicola]|uniref:Uncharacterized protein n=1 Tax=Actinomycetospora corticicola TaxID=663602 RepID=A0A7Y9DS51_9PSEU|nr:hypothetical protein [Actinomycetospora corticicola]NYD34172.1 hypothetical protein [Actinomycetospora corticicola]
MSEQLDPELAAAGYRIYAEESEVVLTGPDGTESRNSTASVLDDDDDADERGVEERAATAARAVLSHVQDAVTATTGRPWPGDRRDLPLPDADVTHGALVAWFGDTKAPVWRSAEFLLKR